MTDVLTIEAAGKRYAGTALTPSAIRRLVRSGEIPSRKVGAKYLITATSIENWLNAAPEETDAPTAGIRRVSD